LDSRECLERWKNCYESLHEIAKMQLRAAEANPFDEGAFQTLSKHWLEMERKVEHVYLEVKEIDSSDPLLNMYRCEVQTLLEHTKELIVRADHLIRGQYSMTGAAVKMVKDRRTLMNAYYGMDREYSVPLFFNEKK